MSIPVLTQVYDEVRRLSIAGSVVAPGDFRLKKLVPPLEQAGAKAPVFAKVAQAVTKVVDSSEKTAADALLELSTLVNAILYTQGETGIAGKLEDVETTDLGQQVTQASARVLKPLLEALQTTGSGRMELIKDAHERGAFRDLRLIKAAIGALDDSYSEIADFVSENILPIYGKAILPEVRAKFDHKGRAGHPRRLALMHKLDPETAREIVKQALEEGSKEVKVVAIECLGGSPEDVVFLLDQVKAKAKDVREAAFKGLGNSNHADAVAALRKALSTNDIELAVAPIRASKNPDVLKFLLEETKDQRDALLAGKEKDKKALAKQVTRFLWLLECFRNREDKASEKFVLETFAQHPALAAIKGDPSGKDIQQRLVSIMSSGSKQAKEKLAEAHASFTEDDLSEAFVAAIEVWPAKKVYEAFSPYLTSESQKKKKDAKIGAIEDVLHGGWRWRGRHRHNESDEDFAQRFDPRWLDAAVATKNIELVRSLARPKHAGANKLLSEAVAEALKKSKTEYECSELIETMVRVEHPDATDSLIAAIKKYAKSSSYGIYWLSRLVGDLPKEAYPKMEALLPTLPEKAIDYLLDYVTQLKNKA